MADSVTRALLAGIGLMVAFDVWGARLAASLVAAVFVVGLFALCVFKLMELQASTAVGAEQDG